MKKWRLIEDSPRSGSFNMAADQVLLHQYLPDLAPVFRIYFWERPTLSLGRNEKLDEGINLEACHRLGVPIVRRLTGGKAVLHGFDLTYSIVGGVLDSQFSGGVLDNYRYISRGFFHFFKTMGLAPKYHQRKSPAIDQEPHLCFAEPSAYEILIQGKKIIGNAQRVKNVRLPNGASSRIFMQHGSIPVRDSNNMLCQIFPHKNIEELNEEMLSLESLGIYPKLSLTDLQKNLKESIEEIFEADWEKNNWCDHELKSISAQEHEFKIDG